MHSDIPSGVCALPGLGVIVAEGEDAAGFLHGQLTQDIALMGDGQARLAGYCSPKGRLLASFIVVKAPDAFWLVCSEDLLEPTLKRLSMFVLRAKVRLASGRGRLRVAGLTGTLAARCAPGATLWDGPTVLAGLPPAGALARALWIGGSEAPLPAGPALPADAWFRGEVLAGVARIAAAVADQFVPQMVNYESVGGVNFRKGCYPGQEVVARSQFRGTIKRRTYIFQSPVALRAGDPLFSVDQPDAPVGTVVQAAPLDGGSLVLACVQLTAIDTVRAIDPQGPALRRTDLPYALVDDV